MGILVGDIWENAVLARSLRSTVLYKSKHFFKLWTLFGAFKYANL